MTAEIDPLIFELRADLAKARASIGELERVTGRGFGRVERDTQRLEKQMLKSSTAIQGSLRGIGAAFAGYLSGRELSGMIDSFTRLQNSLRVAGLEGAKLESVQSQLLDLSTRYGVGIEGLANLYGKATDAGRSFGASEAQVLQLTEATSQSLLITGTSAAQASGAILGLSQALASGTVRAEEYNQINEGGLRPLLQAAAAAEKYGGDINKLRAAVVDGTVSSSEFFSAIMAGAGKLEGQAAKATLTLSGAFEALSSQLTVYVGQAAQANGVTEALAGGLKLLADNLDKIIPALAIIAASMGTYVVASAVAGSRAFFALTAAIGGAATAAEAATFAFGGLNAVLSGPAGVALAVAAVGAALIYFSSQSNDATISLKDLREANQRNGDELDKMIGRLKEAGVQTDELAAAAARAKAPIDELADSYRQALIEARKFNAGTAGGKIQSYNDDILASQGRQSILREYIRAQRAANPGAIREGRKSTQLVQAEDKLSEERQLEAGLRVRIQVEAAGFAAGVDVHNDARAASSSTPIKPERKKKTPAQADPLDAAFRNAQELRQYQLEELRAKEQEATAATEKAGYARQALELEADIRRKDIDESVRKQQLTEEEANARRRIIDNLYGAADQITVQGRETAYQREITRREEEQLARQQANAMRDELDALGAEAGVTDVRKARVEIERRMLDLQQEIERKLLDEAIARGEVLDATQARARLARKQAADRTGFDKSNTGPLGQYVDEVRKVGLNLDDEFEKVAVNGLKSLNDGLTDAIINSESLGDVFRNVAKQIIADLIRIAIQQTIVNSLASAFNMGGGSGGASKSVGNITGSVLKSLKNTPGLASGGYAGPNSLHRVNEHAGGVELLRMGSQGGHVIPLGQVNAAAAPSGQSGGGIAKVQLHLSGDIDARIAQVSGPLIVETIRVSAPAIADMGAQEAMRRSARPSLGRTF